MSNDSEHPAEEIATIGDIAHDVLMFEKSGVASRWQRQR